jgi:hypothetical protein
MKNIWRYEFVRNVTSCTVGIYIYCNLSFTIEYDMTVGNVLNLQYIHDHKL